MKSWIKENWFRILTVGLLLMIYFRLGEVKENTFYTADMVDSSATRVINSMDTTGASSASIDFSEIEEHLNNIEDNTFNTWIEMGRQR